MISVVYFEDHGLIVAVGVFLMMSDAENFIKHTPNSEGYKIKDVDDWQSWSNIRAKL